MDSEKQLPFLKIGRQKAPWALQKLALRKRGKQAPFYWYGIRSREAAPFVMAAVRRLNERLRQRRVSANMPRANLSSVAVRPQSECKGKL